MPRFVQLDFDDAVATLTLNRPDRLNTITRDLISDFREALSEAQAQDETRVIRLKGAGRAFCAGYDIDWGAESMQ
jgi:enoyl-CoA hydratase/carnithine racemase